MTGLLVARHVMMVLKDDHEPVVHIAMMSNGVIYWNLESALKITVSDQMANYSLMK